MKNYESSLVEIAGGNTENPEGGIYNETTLLHQFHFAVTAEVAVIFALAALVAAVPVSVAFSPPPKPED